jgi:hypothetical protein
MADRVSLSMFWVYVLAIPFYLFFNVGVTGSHIPAMQTIAYDLTPEINNWFTRIDPFSNGMPSLHIGLPFAIWLTMQRWDDDGRWAKYRGFLMAFTVLTAFAIIYLGIHWVVDIIGGMAVGILAVQMTSKTNQPFWNVADERLFSRRLARAIADPGKSVRGTVGSIISVFKPLREPNRKQTSAIIAALLLSTGFVLLWDATHQDFPVEGVEWPTSAAGSDGWLVSVEEDPESMSVSISVWNVSDEQGSMISGEPWESSPAVAISGSSLVLHDSHRLDYYELESNSTEFSPKFSRNESEVVLDVAIAESATGQALLVVVHEDYLEVMDNEQATVGFEASGEVFSLVAASGHLVAWADGTSSSPTVNVTSISGSISISLVLDARASADEDEFLEEISGIAVDYSHAEVVDMDMDPSWVVAVVDVGPVNRTVLVNILTGEQSVLSDPKWESSSPSVAHGRVAFLQIPGWDPSLGPEEVATARDVYLHDIEANTTLAITHDEDVDQLDPQVLLEDVAWVEVDSDGTSALKVYSGETFQPYSSVILQAAILMLIPLLFLWAYQAASERRG